MGTFNDPCKSPPPPWSPIDPVQGDLVWERERRRVRDADSKRRSQARDSPVGGADHVVIQGKKYRNHMGPPIKIIGKS